MDLKARQMALPLSILPTENLRAGALRVKDAIREELKRALAALERRNVSREMVAAEISRLTGEDISVHTLNNWCAEGKTNRRFPLECAKALALIAQDDGIFKAAMEPELAPMDAARKAACEYGLMVLKEKHRSRRKRDLESLAARLISTEGDL